MLLPQSRSSSVPSCPDCPLNWTVPYDKCKSHSENVDLDVLAKRARGLPVCEAGSRGGTAPCIDALAHLNRTRVFTSRSECRTYRGPAVEHTVQFYRRFGSNATEVHDKCALDPLHPQERPAWANGEPGMLGACLRHLHGSVAPPVWTSMPGVLTFDQLPFAAPGLGLTTWGTLYVPSACRAGALCALQIWFHGCGTYPPGLFIQYPTAEANNVVMLVPNAASDWEARGHGGWGHGSDPRASCYAGTPM